MSYTAADGAALVAAAVQAAIRERAPRRTVAAVAAAVAGTVMSAVAQPTQATKPKVRTQDNPSRAEETDDPEKLLASLRAVRRAQRLRKKVRRREAKQAAGTTLQPLDPQHAAADNPDEGNAGLCAEFRGTSAVAPAPLPQSSRELTQLTAATAPTQPRVRQYHVLRADLADLGISVASSHSNMTASDIASSGMPLRGQTKRLDPGKR